MVPFADLPLRALRRSHVEAWVKAMSADLAPSTIHTRMRNVRSVLRAAVADKLIATDPSQGVVLPGVAGPRAAMRIPTVEDVGAILTGAADDFRAFVALCAFAGLRMGEASGVQVGDVDFLRRTLRVERQLQGDGKAITVRPPKYGSERVIYLPDELVEILSRHVAAHTPDGDPGRWLFTAYGRPMHPNAVAFRWRAAREKAAARGRPSARPPALLRLGPDRGRLRCRDRPAGPRALLGEHDVEHLQPPLADRGGPDSSGCRRTRFRSSCGLCAHQRVPASR